MKQFKGALPSSSLFNPSQFSRKLSHLAVVAALASLGMHAQAACVGILASPAVAGTAATVTTQCSGVAV